MRHFVAVSALLAALTVAHLGILSSQAKAARETPPQSEIALPEYIGEYRMAGKDIDVGDRVRQALETSTILLRSYVSPGGRGVRLTVVYAGTTRRSLHFPELCLIGAGYEIRDEENGPVGILFNAKHLVLVKGDQRLAVIYWFKTGDMLTGNYFMNAWQWAKNQLSFGTATSAMVKVETPIGSQGEDAAFGLLEDFASKLTPVLLDNVR